MVQYHSEFLLQLSAFTETLKHCDSWLTNTVDGLAVVHGTLQSSIHAVKTWFEKLLFSAILNKSWPHGN